MTEKSRHLDSFTYFEVIQKEYIVCELRSKIYPKRSKSRHVYRDREYFKNVMRGKREKILDFAQRNHMPTIFDSDKIKQQIIEQIYLKRGLPQFIYRDSEEQSRLETLDRRFYYSISAPIKVFLNELDNEFDVGEIKHFDNENDIVKVHIRNSSEVRTVSCKNVCRIL